MLFLLLNKSFSLQSTICIIALSKEILYVTEKTIIDVSKQITCNKKDKICKSNDANELKIR